VRPGSPAFLTLDDVIRLHRYAMLDQGSAPILRDRALLESALAMPRQQFDGQFLHPDLASMGAAYAFHICRNHPFEDGNKRAGTAAMLQFFSDNGLELDATADEAEPVILALAAGALDKSGFTAWVARHCHPLRS
jgi:death-on-curing protein